MAQFKSLGDRAIVVNFGDYIDEPTFDRVRELAQRLEQSAVVGMIEYVPAYTSVTIYYDPLLVALPEFCSVIERMLADGGSTPPAPTRTVEIPVCYGGEFGPDLDFVAQHTGLSTEQVVALHCAAVYRVHMLGFAPGFPYLGGMSPRIAAPRRSTPRLKVPAGSVGIAGSQTGIYSLETPGGWQIIGRTPLALFRPNENPPTLLSPGDMVRFKSVTNV